MGVRGTKHTECVGSFAEVSYKEFVVWFKKLWFYEVWGPFSKGKPDVSMEILCKRCYLQQMLLRVFSVISVRGRRKRNPGVLFKTQLILSCGSSVMFSNGSRDLYFVSKKPQNHEQKNDSTIPGINRASHFRLLLYIFEENRVFFPQESSIFMLKAPNRKQGREVFLILQSTWP